MTSYRYSLEKYTGIKSRHTCPKCEHRQKTFKLYIDNTNGEPLADHVGRCDRQERCGYHYTPHEYFKAYPEAYKGGKPVHIQRQTEKITFDTIPAHYVPDTQKYYEGNNFVVFLDKMFGQDDAYLLTDMYNIGTSKHWPGATIFWQVDIKGKVRTGKIMLYNPDDCKRVKEPFNHITWVHKALSLKSKVLSPKSDATLDSGLQTQDFHLRQCFFGEHLLPHYPNKPVAIVESEKTAVIASIYAKQFVWLAAGSLEGLGIDKCQVLKNRTVFLFPDVNGYAKWCDKARELNLRMPTTTFGVDKTMQSYLTPDNVAHGGDIADIWIDAKLKEWK